MPPTAATMIYETLKCYGVTHLFGMDDPVSLYEALDTRVIKPITVRDEKHGAIMAHGYAKATNRPGVCTAINGPGATNLVSGLAEALKSSTPIIAIIQEMASARRGKNASLEIDQESLLRPVVKWVERLESPSRSAEMTRKVFRIATSGRPGPVALLCPRDIMRVEAEGEVFAEPGCDRYPSRRSRASRASMEEAVELLSRARRPVIIAGGGCIISEAWEEVVQMAEMYRIPVATTFMGKGTIPDSHWLSLGVLGSYTGGKHGRGKIANEIVSQADVAFIIGSRTDQYPYYEWTLPRKGTTIIHLDIDPEEIGRNYNTAVAMVGDVKETLRELIEYCQERHMERGNDKVGDRIKELRTAWSTLNEPLWNSDDVPIRPERLLKELSRYIDTDTIVVTDASYVSGWAASHIDTKAKGCNFLFPRGMAGIGWGLPAAMGAKLGRREKRVFCLTGDGAFGYVMGELETASRYNINVITVVFNNKCFGFQKHSEQLNYGRAVECDLLDVDYSEVARALKCQGERLFSPKEIEGGIERSLSANVPYVLDVLIDPNVTGPLAMFDKFRGAEPVEE